MPWYQEIAADLRERLSPSSPDREPQWNIGDQFWTISEIQNQYTDDIRGEPSITTAMAAKNELEDEGLIKSQQGLGTFVIATRSLREVDVPAGLATLRAGTAEQLARLDTLLAALAVPTHSVTIDLRDPADDNVYFVLTDALGEWAHRQRGLAEQEDQEPDGGNAMSRREWADTADRLRGLVGEAM
ncbi:hypothetical protein [Nocardia sp. NBC_01327]|uniref:hypothetical protein n=1 Tax=Nocardia sp. NBC_01327 TaxID=2903593 RepID=UPI002E1225C6|nr:hypothetical protein OG326_42310 [Nocardia sp. NBC_01327]